MKDAPDYLLRVIAPMDLKTLLKKVVAKTYVSIETFLHDLSLIYQNCVTYNGPEHTFSKIAQVIVEEGNRLVKLKARRLETIQAVISANTP